MIAVCLFAGLSFGQTIEEKDLAVAKNYMIQHKLPSEHVKIDLGVVITDDQFTTLKKKLIGIESVYFIEKNSAGNVIEVKYYMIDHKNLEYKAKGSIEDIVNHAVVFTRLDNQENIGKEH